MFYAALFILLFFSFVSVARFCQCFLPLYFFIFFCVCGSDHPTLYASFFIVVFSFLLCLKLGFASCLHLYLYLYFFFPSVSVARFCQCSMPLFNNCFFSTMPESWFCQCSMPLYLNFYLFFCACVLVLPMFYAS